MLAKTLIATAFTSVLAIPVALADPAPVTDDAPTPVATDAAPIAPPPAPKATCPTEEPSCPTPKADDNPPVHTSPQYAAPAPMVYADEMETSGKPDKYSYAWYDPTLSSGIGVGFQVGAGIGGFTDGTVNDLSSNSVGGGWQFLATIGSHTPIGLDVAYNGTAYDLQPAGTLDTGTLVGTNIEGALRWNILPHYEWNPYIFAGAGWQHYDVSDSNFNLSDAGIEKNDDLAVFPMGLGISYRDVSGITGELRGTFRAAQSSTLITDSQGNDASLHTWEASAGLGYEF